MLAKVPAKRADGRSSFKSLQRYMEGRDVIDPDTGEVTGWDKDAVSVDTNCLFQSTAWREMLAVADMNGRVKDPLYHAVVSWQKDEQPTDEQAFAAVRQAMKAIGMEDHQYVAAVHRDTDNTHVHMMVNRVHPETYRAVYPDRDFYKLDKCMREVEIEQGWKHDRGPYSVHERDGRRVVDWAKESPEQWRAEQREQQRVKQPTKAKDMERYTGNESLHTYAQGQPQKDAQAALKQPGVTWQDLHSSLARHGLELRPANAKQNAFRVHSKDDPGICIKASAMAAELGGGKLIKQLGAWQEPQAEIQQQPAQHEYSNQRPKAEPKRDQAERDAKRDERAAERRELREQYKAFADDWKVARAPARSAMYDLQKQRRQVLVDAHKEHRQAIRASGMSAADKKAAYSVAAFESAVRRADLSEAIKAEREAFRKERAPSFRDWTADRAQEGNQAAMRQVRGWAYQDKRTAKEMQRTDAQGERGAHLATTDNAQREPAMPRRVTERVSWQVDRQTGAVDYKLDERAAFRDNGRRIDYTAGGQKDKDAIEAGLLLAREKFAGQAIKINGPDDFRERVLQTAIERGIDVRFSDKALEQRRAEGREQARPDWAKPRDVESQEKARSGPTEQPGKVEQGQAAPAQPAAPGAAKEGREQGAEPRVAPGVASLPAYVPRRERQAAAKADQAQKQPEQPEQPAAPADQAQRREDIGPMPTQPNQELVELGAIGRSVEAFRADRDTKFRQEHGERPQEREGMLGFASRRQAAAWDKAYDEGVTQKAQAREEFLKSDDPKAQAFRSQAWNGALQKYEGQVADYMARIRETSPEQKMADQEKSTQTADKDQAKPELEKRADERNQRDERNERNERTDKLRRLFEQQERQKKEREAKQQERERDDGLEL